ncbi:MAG: hypothetical protein IPL73_20900 [Candidatus Obscuribacter sp.]|nr:hypothetical protein [Candidatus Obscuribacter sp.]MBP7577134.1 hypothetical protein [Candidatus Obscuribacter sp.]
MTLQIVQQLRKNAGLSRILSYCCAIVMSFLLFILLPMLMLSSEIVPSAVALYRKDSPELADVLEHYGDECQSQIRQLELYQDALDMRVRVGEKDEKTVETISKIWNVKRYWPKYRDTWQKAELEVESSILGRDARETIATRTMWAIALSHQGKYAQSSKVMRENLSYLKQAPGDRSKEIVSMLEHMNGIFRMNGEPLKARVALLEEAIKISSSAKSKSPFGVDEVKSRLGLASLLGEMHDYDEAEKQYRIALKLSERPDNCMRRDSLQAYSHFLFKIGRSREAQSYDRLIAEAPTGRCGTSEPTTLGDLLGIALPF